MTEVKDILSLLAAQEQQRLQEEELFSQREIEKKQRNADLSKLKDELSIALKNRNYSKELLIEQLKRDSSSHGEIVDKLIADTYEAIFLFKYPHADAHINDIQSKIASLSQ